MAIIEELPPENTISTSKAASNPSPPPSSPPPPPAELPPVPVLVVDQELFYDAAEDTAELLKKATAYKDQGNRYFGSGDYEKALSSYQDASTLCPSHEHQQRAIYAGNMAACHLKLNQPKEAKAFCDTALELDPTYLKAKLRRAQANERLATSAALSDALKDYQALLDDKDHHLDRATRATCQRAVRDLPPLIHTRMEKEKEEMISKLKDLGNTVLGKFGLSTDNFQFQQDPSSGNYSMNFVNNPASSSST